jgi:hypothetical protein
VSLEVPQRFDELKTILKGALPFFATVAMIFLFWDQQHKYFRFYGLDDRLTIFLNLAYLAVILFYVYPLKFLFSLLLFTWTGLDLFPRALEKGLSIINPAEFPQLIILFSVGYFLIWLLIACMYLRAYHFRQRLELTTFELLYTRNEIAGALGNAMIGLAAILAALLKWNIVAGVCYLCIPVFMAWLDSAYSKKEKKLARTSHH